MEEKEPFESLQFRRCQWVSAYEDAYRIFRPDGQEIVQPAPSAEEAYKNSGVTEARRILRRERSQEIIIPPGELRDENGNPVSPSAKGVAGVLLTGISAPPLFNRNIKMARESAFQPISTASLNVAVQVAGGAGVTSSGMRAAEVAAYSGTGPSISPGAGEAHISLSIQQANPAAKDVEIKPAEAPSVLPTSSLDVHIQAQQEQPQASSPVHITTIASQPVQSSRVSGNAQVHIQGTANTGPMQAVINKSAAVTSPAAPAAEKKPGNRIEQILAETLLEERLARESVKPAQSSQTKAVKQTDITVNVPAQEGSVPEGPLSAEDVKNLMKPEN